MENLLEKIDKTSGLMSKWPNVPDKHKEFLESIRGQVVVKGKLSAAQIKWLESLQEKYSESALVDAENWMKQFDENCRANVIKLMKYYEANPPYYGDMANRILADPEGFTISANAYNKLVNNKFAKKVIAEYESESQFSVGEMAIVRKSNKVRRLNMEYGLILSFKESTELENKPVVILEVHAKPITRTAKGSKVYKVLPVGRTPVYTYESDLKRARKTKSKKS